MSDEGGAAAHLQLGLMNQRNGWHRKAADCFRQAAQADPAASHPQLLLIAALLDSGQADDASAALDSLLSRPPSDRGAEPALTALGASFRTHDRLAEAARCYTAAAERSSDDALTHQRLGVVELLLHHPAEALSALDRAVALDASSAVSHHNRGVALMTFRRGTEAIAAFTRALEIDPEHVEARTLRMFLLARDCDWDLLEREDIARVPGMGTTTGIVSPFALLSFEDHPERHRLRAVRYAAARCPTEWPAPARPKERPVKLRLGYVSADFRNHAMVHLAGRMFELHNRDRFELHGYALGPPSNDIARQRMVRTFDHFIDVEALSDEAIVARARADGIDIAIDLLGHTQGSRLGIFARRAAAVQINFLGFPGTSGAPFIDYIVVDRVVVPPEHRSAITERLITLPHTYQPSDNQRVISARHFTRASEDLPETGFIFCCFNNSYKIKPREFGIWMRLLREVDNSVLWLVAGTAEARANLRSAAAVLGIDPDRLRFAKPVPVADHLARSRLADLFLDTFVYNAHTTASDALWVGLPVLTKIGSSFASRVAASLLAAIGLSELVTTSEQQYFELALALACDPARLAKIRARLAANFATQPLFDSAHFTRSIEAGYEAAYQRFFDGMPPADICVEL